MKVLTLRQPYATLIALGVKTIETRSQPFRSLVGQRIAIHAAALSPGHMERVGRFCVNLKADRSTVMYDEEWCLANGRDVHIDLPLGAIVCTAVVTESVPMIDEFDMAAAPYIRINRPPMKAALLLRMEDAEDGGDLNNLTDQLPYGDFRPGRFGLLLADVEPLAKLVPFKGGQGLSRSVDPERLVAS